MQVIVNVSDAKASADPEDVLVTYSLGSCIGVMVYDPLKKIAGMLHFQLPSAALDAERARQNPTMFADSGFNILMQMMTQLGADKKRLKAKIAGGAKMLTDTTNFDIGKRNHQAIRKVFWQQGLFLEKEDCGGGQPRTVVMNVADGAITLKSAGQTTSL